MNGERRVWIDGGVGVDAEGRTGHDVQAVRADESKRKVIKM